MRVALSNRDKDTAVLLRRAFITQTRINIEDIIYLITEMDTTYTAIVGGEGGFNINMDLKEISECPV